MNITTVVGNIYSFFNILLNSAVLIIGVYILSCLVVYGYGAYKKKLSENKKRIIEAGTFMFVIFFVLILINVYIYILRLVVG